MCGCLWAFKVYRASSWISTDHFYLPEGWGRKSRPVFRADINSAVASACRSRWTWSPEWHPGAWGFAVRPYLKFGADWKGSPLWKDGTWQTSSVIHHRKRSKTEGSYRRNSSPVARKRCAASISCGDILRLDSLSCLKAEKSLLFLLGSTFFLLRLSARRQNKIIKGIVHSKKKILSLITTFYKATRILCA